MDVCRDGMTYSYHLGRCCDGSENADMGKFHVVQVPVQQRLAINCLAEVARLQAARSAPQIPRVIYLGALALCIHHILKSFVPKITRLTCMNMLHFEQV